MHPRCAVGILLLAVAAAGCDDTHVSRISHPSVLAEPAAEWAAAVPELSTFAFAPLSGRGVGVAASGAVQQASTGLRLTLTAPMAAEDFKVGVDGGGIEGGTRVAMVSAGGSNEVTTTLTLPPGGPYRVRVIARGAGTLVGHDGPGWATGKVTGIMVEEDSLTEASVSVEPYSVEVSAPEEVTRGEEITVEWIYTDPGDVLEDGGMLGEPAGALHYATLPFRDGGGERVPAVAERLAEGEYRMTVTIAAPLEIPGSLYFQVVGHTFGNTVQLVPISLFDPSPGRGESLREIQFT